MNDERHRLPESLSPLAQLTRDRAIRFLFDGRRYVGHPGDTVASALLANGVFSLGLSRGGMAVGLADASLPIQVGVGGRLSPHQRAGQVELYDGLIATSVAPSLWENSRHRLRQGMQRMLGRTGAPALIGGTVPDEADRDRYDHGTLSCDLVVVGGGRSGLIAAQEAVAGGQTVVLVEQDSCLGGRQRLLSAESSLWADAQEQAFRASPQGRLLTRTTAISLEAAGDGVVMQAVERCTEAQGPMIGSFAPRQRLWTLRARRLVLATGAVELPMLFAHNDAPGVMLSSSALAWCRRWAVRLGPRVVVAAADESGYETAAALAESGQAVTVVDSRPAAGSRTGSAERGFSLLTSARVVAVQRRWARGTVKGVWLREAGAAALRLIPCDVVVMAGGFRPARALLETARHLTATDPRISLVGRAGHEAGKGDLPVVGAMSRLQARAAVVEPLTGVTVADLWAAPSVEGGVRGGWSLRVGRQSVGRLSKEQQHALQPFLMAAGVPPSLEVGGAGLVELVTPVALGTIAGARVKGQAAVWRTSPVQEALERAGACFLAVSDGAGGHWRLPRCYLRAGESRSAAITAECLAAREAVAVFDASTMGSFDVQGADAAAFLDQVHLAGDLSAALVGVGRIRYGMMLNDDGLVIADGTCARLGEQRYLLTCAAANAAVVERHLRGWLRRLSADRPWRVTLTAVGEAWASVALVGPRARDVLARLAPDLYLGPRAFPFMTVQETGVADIPARVARVSFTGELSYEISVAASRGEALWEALRSAAEALGGRALGTTALEILRAEKGFVLAGHETEGSVTPYDLGYHRLVPLQRPFVGRDGLARPALAATAAGRLHLVGLLTEDPQVVLPEGAQMVAWRGEGGEVGQEALGHVTTGVYSPTLARSLALGMLCEGRTRHGQTVHTALENGRWVSAVVCDPVFFDPQGRRRDG